MIDEYNIEALKLEGNSLQHPIDIDEYLIFVSDIDIKNTMVC